MQIINIHNVEDLIFYDPEVKKLLPEYNNLFNQWAFAKQNSGFRQLAKRSLSEFLETLENDHVDILSKHFGNKIAIDKMDYRVIVNEALNPEEAELLINNMDGFNFSPTRNKDMLFITFWR